MCGIAGFYHPYMDYGQQGEYYRSILEHMCQDLERRGPDDHGIWMAGHFGLAHTRLAVIDLDAGHQPVQRKKGDNTCAIVYNGELYNMPELRQDLKERGWDFSTRSDAEVVLAGYLEYGPDFVKQMNGAFAFAIADPSAGSLFLFRDRSGIKPLFYLRRKDEILFASEQKGILACPGVRARLDHSGLNEIFSLGPAKTYGSGVFKDIDEVLPGHYLVFSPGGSTSVQYWQLESRPHEDSYEKTVEKTAYLVKDAVIRQMIADVPVCTFLSGGLDSSLISAICASEMKKSNRRLTTFSFDFTDSEKYFQSNNFQPSLDRPFVDRMVDFLQSDHHYLECDNLAQADLLYASVDARDMPAMADVDSSLIHFCSLVTDYSKVALTGECADEIFGGYPWFHKQECFDTDTFPWTMDLNARKILLRDDFLEYLNMDNYVRQAYDRSVSETPRLASDTPTEKRRREIAYLNLKWFMQTLLDRTDRASMRAGLSARVPFADYRIIEYLWNVPWEMKTRDGVVKGLLREAGKEFLPDDILYRRKSPYPKTYDTHYEALLSERVRDIIHDTSSPVLNFIDKKKVEQFLKSPSDYGKPWYGQLMAGPQMLAYLIQVNYWLKKYQIDILS